MSPIRLILRGKSSLAGINANEFGKILESFFANLKTEGTRKEYMGLRALSIASLRIGDFGY